ncbi:Uncharacterised protein [uncultured archaeon]|nr:Uncharacterised protein [uncultured archaeon]
MTIANNPKFLNRPGDYYFCSLCAAWHRCTNDPSSTGNQHLSHLDENETNSPSSKYFYCSLCNKWHTDARKDHLQYRLYIQRDPDLKPTPHLQPTTAPSSNHLHHPPTAILGSFDGAAGLWKTESEHLSSIPSMEARRQCEGILALVKSLDKDLHIQHFNRKNGFSFIVKGLKIGEIKLDSGRFVLTLIQNILNKGYTSVHQVKEDFVFEGSGKPYVSDTDLRNHFVQEAKNLIELRKNNTIGYREKWLHCLLIENMHDGSLSGLDLDFLYYETPVGKVKRNRQFGREHIDILAMERRSKALVVVEVKKQGEDLNSAVSQGLSYVEWLVKYKEHLKPRIAQLGWDVDIENLRLVVLAPDVQIKNAGREATILGQAKRLNCEVVAAYINPSWERNEDIAVKELLTV